MQSTRHHITTNAGLAMPRLLYGTAWKKERTSELVVRAVLQGFRGIDTACQPKHYQEDLVGEALVQLEREHGIDRSSLFLQTKFTSLGGQDPQSVPYDVQAELPKQVQQSLDRSLRNLRTDRIDSLVLHSPMRTHKDTMRVWSEFESFVSAGWVGQLGISNIYDPGELARLYEAASVKPAVVQNRFYRDTDYDREIRAFCKNKGIIYQSFWTLTANPHVLRSPAVARISKERKCTPPQVLFLFLTQQDVVPLSGTTNPQHMKEDLEVMDLEPLSHEEVQAIEATLI